MRHALAAVLAALVTSVAHAPARADSASNTACVQAHRDAQRLRREQKLLEARRRMVVCGGPTCPSMVQEDCAKWLGEIGETIPSVVVAAKDEGGHELTDVKVSCEGHFSARALDGAPIELNPGAYKFRYERPGAKDIERDVVFQTGVRNRVVEVVFPGGKKLAAKPNPPAIAYVLTGLGVVAVGSFTYFGLKGRGEYKDLQDTCAPNCPAGQGDDARRSFLIADVSLGVGAVLLGGAAYFFFVHTPSEPESERTTRAPRVRRGAVPKGVVAGVTARF